MASFKIVAHALFFFAVAVAAATLPPSEARVQAISPDSAPAPPQLETPGSTSTTPTSCLLPLLPVMPCMDYLTNVTVLRPPTVCCDGVKSVIEDAPICLCHGLNGDMDRFLRNPIDPIRMMLLPLVCETMVPLQTLLGCATQDVPPLIPPVAP